MKILQIIPDLSLAGAQRMVESLSLSLNSMGNDVTVLSLFSRETPIYNNLKEKGVKVIFLDKKSGFDLSLIKKIRKQISIIKPDVIHTHMHSFKYTAFSLLFKKKVPIIHTFHSNAEKEFQGLEKVLNKYFFKRKHIYTVTFNEKMKNDYIKEYKSKTISIKMFIVENGINISKFKNKTENYYDKKNFNLIHIGRFSEEKNHKLLIESFKKVNMKNKNIYLTLIGDGKLKSEIELKVNEYNLEKYISIVGTKSDIVPYLHKSDCFILVSKREGMPITILEAQAAGLPVITTNVGAINEVIKHKENGLIVKENIDEVSKAIEYIYQNNDFRIKASQKSLNIIENYSQENMAKKYYSIYAKIGGK